MNAPKNRKDVCQRVTPSATTDPIGSRAIRNLTRHTCGSPPRTFLWGVPWSRCHASAQSRLFIIDATRTRFIAYKCSFTPVPCDKKNEQFDRRSTNRWGASIPPLQENGRRKPILQEPFGDHGVQTGLCSTTTAAMVVRIGAAAAAERTRLPQRPPTTSVMRDCGDKRWLYPWNNR